MKWTLLEQMVIVAWATRIATGGVSYYRACNEINLPGRSFEAKRSKLKRIVSRFSPAARATLMERENDRR